MFRGAILMVDDRGFGFISGQWQNVFFNRSAVEEDEFHLLSIGKSVEYELAQNADPRREMPYALRVRVK